MKLLSKDLPAGEESKRLRCWDPAQRKRAIQDAISWAERQMNVPRNSPSECLRHERAALGRLAKRG